MRNLKDIFSFRESESISGHLDMAVEGLIDGDSSATNYHLIEMFYDELSDIPIVKTNERLFRFVKIPYIKGCELVDNPIIKDIRSGSLTLSNPVFYNDPMDPIIRQWLKIQEKEASNVVDRKLHKMEGNILKKNIRMLSLVGSTDKFRRLSIPLQTPHLGYCNPLMWAHYADSHKGICIEYEVSNEAVEEHCDSNHILRLCDIRYRAHKVMSDYITIDNALLAKGDCWEYEDEKRLIYFTKDNSEWRKDGTIANYVTLPGFKVNAVYLGTRINSAHLSVIQNTVKCRNIDLYQMKFDMSDITKLMAERVE